MKNIFKLKKYLPSFFLFFVICYLLFLIRPAIFGQLGGTFKIHSTPQEYSKLETFLNKQDNFSRTLWIPIKQRYGYYSPNHPAVYAQDLYKVTNIAGVLNNLKKQKVENRLQDLSIKYVIVPYDPDGELFLRDRKYDDALYNSTINSLKNLYWLKELPGFARIHVFEIQNVKDHIYLANDSKALITYKFINPTEYAISIKNGKKGDRIIFSEAYDKNWQLSTENQKISSTPFENTINSYILPKDGDYNLNLFYTPQKWVNLGLIISGITFLIVVSYFSINFFYTKRNG